MLVENQLTFYEMDFFLYYNKKYKFISGDKIKFLLKEMETKNSLVYSDENLIKERKAFWLIKKDTIQIAFFNLESNIILEKLNTIKDMYYGIQFTFELTADQEKFINLLEHYNCKKGICNSWEEYLVMVLSHKHNKIYGTNEVEFAQQFLGIKPFNFTTAGD